MFNNNNNALEAFRGELHARLFDNRFKLTNRGLKNDYEMFNEIKLFIKYKPQLRGNSFLDLGCATGELYRYIKHYHKDLSYFGIDISEKVIKRAKEKYPKGKFFLIDEKRPVSEAVKNLAINPDIVFVRDVVPHQVRPFEFIRDFVQIPRDMAIFRVRTRDKGATILDADSSCQLYCEKWVPYMVLNIEELIESILSCARFEHIHIVKNYMQLGGYNGRYLPKDCYFPETGTAETAIFLRKSESPVIKPKIEIEENKEKPAYANRFRKKPFFLVESFIKKLFKLGK